jgi:hypothetical protein
VTPCPVHLGFYTCGRGASVAELLFGAPSDARRFPKIERSLSWAPALAKGLYGCSRRHGSRHDNRGRSRVKTHPYQAGYRRRAGHRSLTALSREPAVRWVVPNAGQSLRDSLGFEVGIGPYLLQPCVVHQIVTDERVGAAKAGMYEYEMVRYLRLARSRRRRRRRSGERPTALRRAVLDTAAVWGVLPSGDLLPFEKRRPPSPLGR